LQGVAVVPLIDVHGGGDGTVAKPERRVLPRRQVSPYDEPVFCGIRESAILTPEVLLVG
jgi:hypothetical protein